MSSSFLACSHIALLAISLHFISLCFFTTECSSSESAKVIFGIKPPLSKICVFTYLNFSFLHFHFFIITKTILFKLIKNFFRVACRCCLMNSDFTNCRNSNYVYNQLQKKFHYGFAGHIFRVFLFCG